MSRYDEQVLISYYYIHTLSSAEVMRIKKIISYAIFSSFDLPPKFPNHQCEKYMANSSTI